MREEGKGLVSINVEKRQDLGNGDHIRIEFERIAEDVRARANVVVTAKSGEVIEKSYLTVHKEKEKDVIKVPFPKKGTFSVGYGVHVHDYTETQRTDNR